MNGRKIYVLGDVHGNARALEQVYERSPFRPERDTLIFLGDVVDGYPEAPRAIDLLLECNNVIPILGNHDQWAYQWATKGIIPEAWRTQGGQATIDAYRRYGEDNPFARGGGIPDEHILFLERARRHRWWTWSEKLFVHAGIDPNRNLASQRAEDLIWNRRLVEMSRSGRDLDLPGHIEEVFVGHTTTQLVHDDDKPYVVEGVWMLDTGAGWDGRLTIMDTDSYEYWQSDPASELYPDYDHGRA